MYAIRSYYGIDADDDFNADVLVGPRVLNSEWRGMPRITSYNVCYTKLLRQKYRREGRSERFATLLGMLDLMDAQVGRLLQHLEA